MILSDAKLANISLLRTSPRISRQFCESQWDIFNGKFGSCYFTLTHVTYIAEYYNTVSIILSSIIQIHVYNFMTSLILFLSHVCFKSFLIIVSFFVFVFFLY